MIRFVRTTLMLASTGMLLAHPAFAQETSHHEQKTCLIRVAGKTYLQGKCDVMTDEDGSISVGVSDKTHAKYFAYVTLDDDTHATGFWNGVEAESHAQDPLGTLTRSGDCWSNNNAKICAER
jgi:hypothetical protein